MHLPVRGLSWFRRRTSLRALFQLRPRPSSRGNRREVLNPVRLEQSVARYSVMTLWTRNSPTVVVGVAVPPLPVIVLLPLTSSGEVVIFLAMFLQVGTIRLVLGLIPFMRVVVRAVFVAPALFLPLALSTPVLVTFLAVDGKRNNQGRT